MSKKKMKDAAITDIEADSGAIKKRADIEYDVEKRITTKISEAIMDQAETTMNLLLDETRRTFEDFFLQKLGMKIHGADGATEAEIINVFDFVRGTMTPDSVWDESPQWRERLIDRYVTEWKGKTR